MYVAGTVGQAAARSGRCGRACGPGDIRKSGRPCSLRAMISPSTSRSRSPSGLTCDLGPRDRDVVAVAAEHPQPPRPRDLGRATRTPSHLTSCTHSAPRGTWVPLVASIGRMVVHVLSVQRGLRLTMRAIWKGASRSAWSACRSSSTPPPSPMTCRSVRCTRRTAAGSSTNASARSTARRCPTPTSPRATRPRTARWSSSTTTTSPSCRSTSSREIAVEKFVPSDQIDPMLVREVLLPRAREDAAPSRTPCCARRCRTPTGWPS